MSSALINEYRKLVDKYLAGDVTAGELQLLDHYYNLFRDVPDITSQMDDSTIAALENRLQERVAGRIIQLEKPAVVPLYNRLWFRIAAMLLLFSAVIFFAIKKTQSPKSAGLANPVASQVAAVINRFTILPDGSHILLHGSSLLQVAQNFNHGKTREVTLSGEAYFDIKHDSRRPFIIHTGSVTTTVLGTAFIVKAYPGQNNITVTVTRGRVKVEQGQKLLAILTPNKQLTANIESKTGTGLTRQVIAAQALTWASVGMSFDNMPFSQLAGQLGKRYDVHISFKNPALASCPITGRFKGTETLQEVLDILSQTRGTTYQIAGKEVAIDGKGCNE